jgi:hypothetical protein
MSYGCTVLEGMVHYVNQLYFESSERYEREMKEYKTLLLLAESNGTDDDPDQPTEPAKMKAPDGTNDASMNIAIPDPQNISIPKPQIISTPNSQNISFLDTQNISNSQSQVQSTASTLELPSQNSPNSPLPILLPPTAARTDQEQEEQRTIQNLNANNLTINQALELFELLATRRAAEVVRPPTIEAQQIEISGTRTG